jgi:hypothetical protein
MGRGTKRSLGKRLGSFFSGMTGWMTAAAALIAAVVGGLTAVGVIGGGSAGSGSAAVPSAQASMTVRDWAARANKICGRYNDAINALPQAQSIGKNASEAADLIRSSDKLSHQMLRELTALTPPKGKERQIAQFIRLGADLNGGLDVLTDDVTVGDLSGALKQTAEVSRLNTEFNQAAIALGATTCAEGGSPNIFGGS